MMSSAKCELIFVRHGFTIGLSHIGMHYENFNALIFLFCFLNCHRGEISHLNIFIQKRA
jgi:hypothetical protein